MNALEASPEALAALETRERLPGKIEVRCPTCGEWRRGFLVVKLDPEAAAANGGIEWACDADSSHAERHALAEARAADLDALEFELHAQIDTDAGNFRRRFITDIPGQQESYRRKGEQARAFLEAAAPDPADYPYLVEEAAELGVSVAAVAADIDATAALWIALDPKIEARRRGAKVRVSEAKQLTEGAREAMIAAATIDWQALAGES